MPDLDKILPLIIVALWYIFRGKKKPKKNVAPIEYEQEQDEAPNRAPSGGKSNSLQDILEELMGEEKARSPQSFKKPQAKAAPQQKQEPIAEPARETYAERQSKKSKAKAEDLARLIKAYEQNENDSEQGEHSDEDFDLKQAIIHQVILERPYKD
jgi:hypothetical protein